MYTAVNGIYENGQLILTERPPTTRKTKVVVLFLDENHQLTQCRHLQRECGWEV